MLGTNNGNVGQTFRHQGEIVRCLSADPLQTEPVPCSGAMKEVVTEEILRSLPLTFVSLPDGGGSSASSPI